MDLRRRSERIFRRLEGGVSDDANLVMDAAAALDVGEYDLFRLAWRHWHAGEPEPARLERIFAAYMFHQAIPPWVRQFTRDVLRLEGNGTLAPAKFGAARPRPPQPPVAHGPLYVAGVGALTLLFVALLIATPNDPVNGGDVVCRGGPGMALVQVAARLASGQANPFSC